MSQIGRKNTLQVLREVDFGVYLDGEELGDILLPRKEVPEHTKINDMLEVFLYFDSKDTIIASTKKPKALVDEFASLRVVDTNKVGAFLDWGLPKDLLVPFREQTQKLVKNRHYVVYVYYDRVSHRIAASMKLDKFLNPKPPAYKPADQVDLLIVSLTELGYKAIVDGQYWGLLFKDQVFKPLEQGDRIKGFIKNVRKDGKLDLTLQQGGRGYIDTASQAILTALKKAGGALPYSDKTDPEIIQKQFGLSKKAFKRSLGGLYKRRLIVIEAAGIRLAKPGKK